MNNPNMETSNIMVDAIGDTDVIDNNETEPEARIESEVQTINCYPRVNCPTCPARDNEAECRKAYEDYWVGVEPWKDKEPIIDERRL